MAPKMSMAATGAAAGAGGAPNKSIGLMGAGAGATGAAADPPPNMSKVPLVAGAAGAAGVGCAAKISANKSRSLLPASPATGAGAALPLVATGAGAPPKTSAKSSRSPPAALGAAAAARVWRGSDPTENSSVDNRFCNNLASTTGMRARASLAALCTVPGTVPPPPPSLTPKMSSVAAGATGALIPRAAFTSALNSQERNCNSNERDFSCCFNKASRRCRAAASPLSANRSVNLA